MSISLLASILVAYNTEFTTSTEIAVKQAALANLLSNQEFIKLPLLFAVEPAEDATQHRLVQRTASIGSSVFMLPYNAAIANYLACKHTDNEISVGIDIGYEFSRISIVSKGSWQCRDLPLGGVTFICEAANNYQGGNVINVDDALKVIKEPLGDREDIDPKAFFQSMRAAYELFASEIVKALTELSVPAHTKVYLFGGGAKIPALSQFLNKNSDYQYESCLTFSDRPTALFDNDGEFAIPIGLGLRYFEKSKIGNNMIRPNILRRWALARTKRVCCVEFGHGALRAAVIAA